MARRSAATPPPQRPVLTADQKRRGIAKLERRIEELEAFDVKTVQRRFTDPNVTTLETAIDETLSTIFGHGTVEYGRYSWAASLDHGGIQMRGDPMFGGRWHNPEEDVREAQQHVAKGKEEALALLRQAVKSVTEEIEEESHNSQTDLDAPTNSSNMSKVFVVHGHDEGARLAVARFLEKIELEAIILQEQPDQGLTIIEKFEAHARQVGFAVVVLTPDDLGGLASAATQVSRARQNVIFELGYFAGKLGRGRACLLRKGDVEIPSDLYGVIYTDMDAAEGWKIKLVKEIKAAGLSFDANKVWE
jgi:predicted nucleotide-binding protein